MPSSPCRLKTGTKCRKNYRWPEFRQQFIIRFRCTCSREKMGAVLRALPIPERMEMVQKKEPIAVLCHFCRERYVLTIEECIKAWNTKP